MSFSMKLPMAVLVLIAVMVMLPQSRAGTIGKCWSAWSRCTRWSSGGTGIFWQSCNNRCICRGQAGGYCKLVPSECPWSKNRWRCTCYGRRSGAKPRWCGFLNDAKQAYTQLMERTKHSTTDMNTDFLF